MSSICGVNCDECKIKDKCKGCIETNGHPWGGNCVLAELCYDKNGNSKEKINAYKNELIKEIDNIKLDFIPKIEELYPLNGMFVNIEYELHNGKRIKLLKDNDIYLGTQLPKEDNSGYYGIIADNDYILVSEYDNNYQNAKIIIYKQRKSNLKKIMNLRVKMEFKEKIQKLRNKNNLTQEQLSEKLYVSRTAISKWESGKGYPNIDTLKDISKLFNVTIDDLLSSEEILNIAKTENVSNINKFNNLVYSLLDMISILLIFLPLFGQKIGDTFYSVSLLNCNDLESNIKILYILTLGILTLFGLFELILNFVGNKKLRNIINIISIIVESISVLFFILSRQPYLTSIIFIILIIKISIIIKANFNNKKLL